MKTKTNKERVMPQAPEAEKAVLKEMMLNNLTIPTIEGILSPNDFYDPRHKCIYQGILHLYSKQLPVDIISMSEELKRMEMFEKLGGFVFLAELIQGVFLPVSIEHYSHIIKQKSIARNLIRVCTKTVNECFDESKDIADIIENLEIEFTQLVSNIQSAEAISMEEAVEYTLKQIKQEHEDFQKGIQSGIPTHLKQMTDAYGGGFKAPELIVLGARPSMGKTQHALELSYAAGLSGHNTLFCSLEMNTSQLIKRLILRDERINEKHIYNGRMTGDEFIYLDESVGAIRPAKMFFADSYQIRNLSNIKQEARRLKRKYNLKFLVVDYLGLIKTGLTFSLRTQEIAHTTGELKSLAKELDIAVLLLCQLSRPIKGMQVKLPVMEDLRESGDIEQDADTILLLHKPDYYDPEQKDDDGIPWKNRGMLIRAKYREGERNITFQFAHDSRYKKIYDYIPDSSIKQATTCTTQAPLAKISNELTIKFTDIENEKTDQSNI